MLVAREAVAGGGKGPVADTVTLDLEGRRRRRIALTTDGGVAFLLDLPEVTDLKAGDGLKLSDGRTIRVIAAPEPLMEVTARDGHLLMRLVWHIGNRHLAAMIGEGRVLLRRDHVIADMIRGLGGEVRDVTAPFEPEGGAYAKGGHGHGHAHAHHAHGHGETHAHSHGHAHG